MRQVRLKRILCAIAAAVMLAAFSGCKIDVSEFTDDTELTPSKITVREDADEISMAYNSSLTLNPFDAETSEINLQIARLCYEPLFALDSNMLAYAVLASGVEKIDETKYRIALDNTRTFWDGSLITPQDVVFSYKLAAQSGAFAQLSTLVSSLSVSKGELYIALNYPDINFPSALDFPVIKSAKYAKPTAERLDYIGSGLYRPVITSSSAVLELNAMHPSAQEAGVNRIVLENMPDFEAMSDSVTADIIQCAYSGLPGQKLPAMSGNLFPVPQNRMVYIGFSKWGSLATDYTMRSAISMAINRSSVAAYYGGYATVASTPFNPSLSKVETVCESLAYDFDGAALTVAQASYKTSLKLAVNSENELRVSLASFIKGQLGAVGIKVVVSELSFEEYTNCVLYGGCDMYIGEIYLAEGFSFKELLDSTDSKLGLTCSPELALARDTYLQSGNAAPFLRIFNYELPFVPLVYRSGVVFYSSNLVITRSGTFGFAFENIEKLQRIRTVTQ